MQDIFDTPPPYQAQEDDNIYLSDMDLNAWPSSYYGRTRRIDLAKFYHDILKASGPAASDQEPAEDLACINRISSSSSSCSCSNSSNSSSEASDEEENSSSSRILQHFDQWDHIGDKLTRQKKQVRFSQDPPKVFEYEPEYPLPLASRDHSLFDDGWPGRTKLAMKSSGFIDFKSKIEAKLGAINDPALVSQLDSSNADVDESSLLYNQQNSPLYRGYYRNRKSPLVKKLNLRPIPNEPSLMLDSSPSPSNSYTDSPLTPKDNHHLPILSMGESISTTSSTSNSSTSTSIWLKTLSRIRNSSK